jgi:hypothetical protein
MTATVTPRDAVNWQTLLQIIRLLPIGNQTPLVSFTNPDDAARFMRQQDPPGKKLCLLTKDATLFWIVPISIAEQLVQNGFQQAINTIYL